jgi:hypothetical protein
MESQVRIEIVGLKDISCSPFPCDNTRSCGLYDCYPSGKLVVAFEALSTELREEFGDRVELRLTLIDDKIPPHIRDLLETQFPPLPIVLVNGCYVPVGRISLTLIGKEVEKVLSPG